MFFIAASFSASGQARRWLRRLDDPGQVAGLLLVGIGEAQEELPQRPPAGVPGDQRAFECRAARTAAPGGHPLR